jgi:tetratricopeptide (TPR) repeat protein
MRRRLPTLGAATLLAAAAFALAGCATEQRTTAPKVADVRRGAQGSHDPEEIGRWLLAELVSPGGDAREAEKARKRLDELGGRGLYASLARGLDDGEHGKLTRVSESLLGVVSAARTSSDPRAPLFAWLAAHDAAGYRHAAPDFWKKTQASVEGLLRAPGNIGWRARLELAEWWAEETRAAAVVDADRRIVEQQGCMTELRLAGPFGHNTPRDTLRAFPAELPGPWAARWEPDPQTGEAPHLLKTETHGCTVSSDDPVPDGIAYAETFFDVDQPAELVVAVQGAFAVWVDDTLVLRRDLREWGSWLRFGVRVGLDEGRHRIVAKLGSPSTSIRVLYPDGRPYGKPSSAEPTRPYVARAPRSVLPDNVLDTWVSGQGVKDPGDDLVRYFGAQVAEIDDQSDVASVLIDPLVADAEHATGVSLAAAAAFVQDDPVYADAQRRDLSRELGEHAVKKDARLWQPRLAIAGSEAERTGPIEAARDVATLVDQFPEVPAVLSELADLYHQLGWSAEFASAARRLEQRFPDDPQALEEAVVVHDQQGEPDKADALVKRILELDPDNEIALGRALERDDYKAALAELERLGKRRPDRKDIAERIHDVMVRAGNEAETWKKLEAAIAKDPREDEPRLALADARYAKGDKQALIQAVVQSVQHGAPTGRLEAALDLVEGATELEPYRIDTDTVIREFEHKKQELSGTAARVLDYSALWIHGDGSSRLLEHEIVRVQSAEAIGDMAEQPLRAGRFLKLRVLKRDGSVLEPEVVAGKPTVTMPHLEVGDYIETERIESSEGDGRHGVHYVGPRWFFREENIAYARSEFVVISPSDKQLQIETRNEVPAPTVTEGSGLIVRRWRVDRSPAAPVEPFGAPITEFLPSVQIGWGISLDATLRALADSADDLTPVDPRVQKIAEHVVEPLPPTASAERARKLYHWVTANVEEGQESDGRRVIVSKNGNLWRGYLALCRSLGIQADYAVVQNRLTLPPSGPFSSSMQYTQPLLRVRGQKGDLWLTLGSKHAPFGYVPAEVRGMPAVVFLGDNWEKTQSPAAGALDRAATDGKATLAVDGTAALELVQTFEGKYATGLRTVLSQLPERQIRDAIEGRLLGSALHGVELLDYHIEGVADPDAPIRIVTRSRARSFAQIVGGALLVAPPNFTPRLSQFATLPARQTPLLMVESISQDVRVAVKLPTGSSILTKITPVKLANGERRVEVDDSAQEQTLVFERHVNLPAGRIQPNDYPSFLEFTRQADEALAGSVRVRVTSK